MSKIYGIGDEEELAEDLQKELPNRIIEELEKIKAEIRGRCRFSISKIDVLDIIDNHISELKGENNE